MISCFISYLRWPDSTVLITLQMLGGVRASSLNQSLGTRGQTLKELVFSFFLYLGSFYLHVSVFVEVAKSVLDKAGAAGCCLEIPNGRLKLLTWEKRGRKKKKN